MFELKIEFEENAPGKYPRVFAQIIIEGYQPSRLSGMPAVTRDCDCFHELEAELRAFEREIVKVRKRARRLFTAHAAKQIKADSN
jgi:hypothetical protein